MNPGTGRPVRIGMFGGAFDPPHRGHVALATAALRQLALDALHIVPTGQAWHKQRVLTSADHRLAMCALAFAALSRVVVDPRETLRAGPSYTVDSALELQAQYPGCQLFLILGADQARALPSWHRHRDLCNIAIICVAARAISTLGTTAFDSSFGIPCVVQHLDMPMQDVSATGIRERLVARQSIEALVLEPVARYIDHHHLYQSP